jgi:hypothetical protein
VSTDEHGTTHWRIDVSGGGVAWPYWFTRVA